jgi:hypothetical protein
VITIAWLSSVALQAGICSHSKSTRTAYTPKGLRLAKPSLKKCLMIQKQ